MAPALLAAVLLIATCGLVYELVAGALASYLLGDSVTQFSTVIGAYLFAMGIGSWLSRYIVRSVVRQFVLVQILIAFVGGLSSAALFLVFGWTEAFRPILYAIVIVVGTLVGLEIPLLMRILRDRFEFKDVVAHVLTFDYLGALVASVLFPTILVPKLGLLRAAMFFGLINGAVALWTLYLFRDAIPRKRSLGAMAVLVMALLVGGMFSADRLLDIAESGLYADDIILARTTPYQRIVVTAWRNDLRLFLNSHLQFSSRDEYRYHESLVHPALLAGGRGGPRLSSAAPRRVLILGGGDGLALREVLAHPVEAVTLVDLDPAMTELGREFEPLAELNRRSFFDARVEVVNQDAMIWIESAPRDFDVAIVDFPDPNTFALGKLYTRRFFQLLAQHLAPDAAVSIQATSPLFARQSYWCIVETMKSAGFFTRPYHVAVPSFGEWGFVLAKKQPFEPPRAPPEGVPLRFLNADALASMFEFPADMGPVEVEINRLDNQRLVHYYEDEWRRWQ
jgi:spermidine synthase